MAAVRPPAIRVNQKLNINKWLNKYANKISKSQAVQRMVFDETRIRFRQTYELAYKGLITQILDHLAAGFPGAETGTVVINFSSPLSGAGHTLKKQWKPLSSRYRKRKFREYAKAQGQFLEAEAKRTIAKGQKKKMKPNPFQASRDTSNLFWAFRGNLSRGALATAGFSVAAATVTMEKNTVKKAGVLVTKGNKATIRFNVGLKFGKLASPFDDMVRKPFVTGLEEKSRVWDERAGPSNKLGREIHALAYVEAKRPFIVSISASMGRMVRQRLRVKH